MNRRGTNARIVRYVVEASGHVEVLIPHSLYRKVLRFMRVHHVQATVDEVFADFLVREKTGKLHRGTGGKGLTLVSFHTVSNRFCVDAKARIHRYDPEGWRLLS
jgi:hypothetical protein